MLRLLKLLKYLHKINLSPEETLALMQRLETDSCRAEDYEVLSRLVEAHIELSSDVLEALPDLERSSPVAKSRAKRQRTQRPRRRPRG